MSNNFISIIKKFQKFSGMRVIGTFKEKLELGSFPFDSQVCKK